MIVVDLKRLGKQAGPAIRYLNSQLDEPITARGALVQLRSTKAKSVKMVLHKFLHQNGMEEYRVAIVRPDFVEVLGPKPEKRQTQPDIGGIVQNNETIPYYQVAAEWGVVPKPGRRRWKP